MRLRQFIRLETQSDWQASKLNSDAPSPSRIYEWILITYLVMCAIQLPNFWPSTYWPAMVEPSVEMVTASVRIVPAGILAPSWFNTLASFFMWEEEQEVQVKASVPAPNGSPLQPTTLPLSEMPFAML